MRPDPTQVFLCDEIRSRLRRDRISQREMAERVGISQKHLSALLNGKASMSFEMAQRILAEQGRRLVIGTCPLL